MRKRCSIQQGEKNNSWSEQSPEKSTVWTVPFFLGHPVYLCNCIPWYHLPSVLCVLSNLSVMSVIHFVHQSTIHSFSTSHLICQTVLSSPPPMPHQSKYLNVHVCPWWVHPNKTLLVPRSLDESHFIFDRSCDTCAVRLFLWLYMFYVLINIKLVLSQLFD